MKLQIEVIDPAYAKQALEQNAGNRNIVQDRVNMYAADMKAGRWDANGETLKFTADGRLLDGQHRMHAIILSQCTVSMAVARGVSEDAFKTIDSGRARKAADVLSIEGLKNVNQLAAVGKMSYLYISNASLRSSLSKSMIVEHIELHKYIEEVVNKVVATRVAKTISATSFATVLYLGNHQGRYDTELNEFVEGFVSGQGLFKGDARYTLREWAIRNKSDTKRYQQEAIFVAIARAWNAFVMGKELIAITPRVTEFKRKYIPIEGFNRQLFPRD